MSSSGSPKSAPEGRRYCLICGLEPLQSDFANPLQISYSVRAKYKTHNPRNKIVQFLAPFQIFKISTFGARAVAAADRALFHRAVLEHRLFTVTSPALVFREGSALRAHQTAVRDDLLTTDFGHSCRLVLLTASQLRPGVPAPLGACPKRKQPPEFTPAAIVIVRR